MKYQSLLLSSVLFFSQYVSISQAWSLADRLIGRAQPYKPLKRCDIMRRNLADNTKRSQRDMMDFIQRPVESLVGDLELPPKTTPENDELADFVRSIVKAADGRKAENIVAMRVSHITTLTSFVVIVSGNSRPQNQAIAAAITKDVEEQYMQKPGGAGVPEGNAESGWILLDYGSVMVHIMSPKSRLYYNVEGQWKDKGGEYMNLQNVLIPNVIFGQKQASADSEIEQEEDPFWS